ncbi:NYN domain-containing protein [Thermosynechococcus sp. HN-54]|uniref:NYN domain-containing protein n=1 Tax=Thermosynechococcus sp. HN-54 TaxID=2933959 RepID=UPI00202D0097|nr:NYN domain-containing protein [Thermosynechococcus sp. HN-54]URR35543.1 NYN domain-containing protein [Thermosynechococcus sp. HN-54]
MKPELWFVAPVSAIALGGIATLIQPQQPLATLLGSGIGALAGAPLIEKNQRRSDRLIRDIHTFLSSSPATTELKTLLLQTLEQQGQQLSDLEEQLHQTLPKALCPMQEEVSQTLQTLRQELARCSPNPDLGQQLDPLLETINAQGALLQNIQTLLQKPQPPATTLKTAVLYDIENLVFNQGQRLDPAKVNELISLNKILQAIKEVVDLGEIAIQRAYGNWQNQILQALNEQLEQSQIERVGVYGRNRDQRNAADIQLAIDAIALIYEYPDINTFVLISGDGGFGSIALRLRDYGKTVIGCAYRNAASDSFQRVCHQFICLENPFIAPATNGRNGTPSPQPSHPANGKNHGSAVAPALAPPLPVEPLNYDQIPLGAISQRETEKLLELLSYYTSNAAKRQELVEGITFDTVFLDIKAVIPQLEPLRFGFFKPSEWVGYLADQQQLPVCIAVNSQLRKAVLCWRDQLPEHCTVRTYEPQNIHTISIYRSIFAHEVAGDPLLAEVGRWLVAHRPRNMASKKIIHTIFEQIRSQEQPISKLGIKRAIANYVRAGILIRTANTLTLNPAIKDFATLVIELQTRFRQAVEARLSKIGETINEQVFAQAVPLRPLKLPNPNNPT